jgi:hypothetical protein
MTGSGVHRLSRFMLDTRTTYSTNLRTFVEFVVAQDPGARFDLSINLSAQRRSELGSHVDGFSGLFLLVDAQLSRDGHDPEPD